MSTPSRHARLMELFDQACELPRPLAKAFVDALTGADLEFKVDLAAMLEVDGSADKSEVFHTRGAESLLARDLLDTALARTPPLPEALANAEPKQLGEYEVLEKLGSGGMGSVYRARQSSPARVVALKTLHPWLISPAALERFRFEAQALASLTHPSIPPVYAVGQHGGLVYFAMELIEGPSLWDFAVERKLDARAKVELLARVAEAVHHAHLRGFVHRDLKPDNVRVTHEGTPKVLDFGIAAGLGSHRAEVAGTPAYMSPEQFDPTAAVDVRTDVYSLGVMLFELLAGRRPHDLPKSGLATIREAKRQPPLRLSQVDRDFGFELDAIVSKSLELDPERRYGSAQELAEDLHRWLDHKPVRAVAGGRAYRFSRFVRRNRALVFAASLTVLALVVGVAVSTWFFFDARKAAKTAELEASRAKASVEFLAQVLNEGDSDNNGGRSAPIGQAIDHAAEKLEKGELDAYVEAFLRASLTNTYVGLGEWQHAKAQALGALEAYQKGGFPEDEQHSEILRVVSEVYVETGEMKEGLDAAERSLKFELATHGQGTHVDTAYSFHVAGIARRAVNDFAGAVEAHRRAIAMEREIQATTGSSYLADALDQLCLTLVTWGHFDEARPYVAEAIAMNEKKFGRNHQVTGVSIAHLGWLELNAGHFDVAAKVMQEVADIRRPILGENHMRYAQGFQHLALAEFFGGHPELAEPKLKHVLEVAKKAFGEDSGRYAWHELNFVDVLLWKGEPKAALDLAERDLKVLEAMYGADRDATLHALIQHAKALHAVGREDDARAEGRKAFEMAQRMFGDSPAWLRRQAEALPR